MSAVLASDRSLADADGDGEAAGKLLSVVIPCLNEAENIERCVTARSQALELHGIPGEVIVADNGSEDGSGGSRRTRRARASCTSPAADTAAPTWPGSPPRAAPTS